MRVVGGGVSDVGARERFMESSSIMTKISKLVSEFKKNDRKNLNTEFVQINFKHIVVRKGTSINSFTVNTTGYCCFMIGSRVTYHLLQGCC
jgi:hypothetical protein